MAGGVTRHETSGQRTAATGEEPIPLVPSRQQYLDLKAQHPGAILLYRLGDFYEAFDDDALTVARDARITLTSRGFGRGGRVPMAGIPYHALNHYLGRLLAAGHTIAIAEQMSQPGRGLVERAITRVLTPGTVAEPALLPAAENRYLAAVLPLGDRWGLAWVDVSTGEFAVMEFTGAAATARLAEEVARLNPAECLTPDDQPVAVSLPGHQTRLEHWHFAPARAREALCRQFGVQGLAAYGCADLLAATGAAGAILAYLAHTNPALLPQLTGLRTEEVAARVSLDGATRRNLELLRGLRTGGSRGSLLGVLDETHTAMGGRALRRLLGQPSRDLAALERRQAIVAALVGAPATRAALAGALAQTGDLERLVGRVTQGQATARDFLGLGAALALVPALHEHLRVTAAPALLSVADALDPCPAVADLIAAAIVANDDGNATIRPGFQPTLDAARSASQTTRHWLATLERTERERTGIRSLKVGFNKVFGYYIEVTRPNLSLVPAEYHRKQTVATGERYVTTALKEAEAHLLAADEEIAALERAALVELAERMTVSASHLLATAGHLATLDALLALAGVADRANWTRPVLDESEALEIVGGRHPVVEASLSGEPFMPNDCHLGGDQPRLLLVTGPNMGGKSTYLRQVALIVLLAQVGSFVPATAARIGLVDRIFTRVGAQDDLAGGASTFMVEMVETATILHQATRRSLVILDEVGRGTSTDDGLAIAQAVVEDLHDRVGARTLFATHYLELTGLAASRPGLANVHVAVLEAEGRVIFLHAVRPGPADRSYGIQVARLAGLPPWVADRAEGLVASHQSPVASGQWLVDEGRWGERQRQLAESEPQDTNISSPTTGDWRPTTGDWRLATGDHQLSLAGFAPGPGLAVRLAHDLAELDLTELTPRAALEWLFDQQARLRGGA